MKIFKFLTSKTGKMALSALQAVGLSAAVGVAGIAAWQMLGSSSEANPNTAFSSADEEVVFVAGGPGAGAYSGVGYGEGGEVRSGIRAKLSKDMELMQIDAQRAQIPQEPQVIRQEQQVSAYQMDGVSEGLGMGKNAATELGAGAGGMEALQQQIAALQASAAVKQKEAEANAVTGDAAAAAAAMQGKGAGAGKWGMTQGMARAGGSNLNSTPLQAGAYGAEGESLRGGVLGGGESGQMLAAANRQARFEGGRDSVISEGERFRNSNSLEGMRKQSSDVAGNKYRSANESTRVFMAGEKMSGGIRLDGENVTIGGGSASDDFSQIDTPNVGAVSKEIETYEEARENLRRELRKFVVSCNRWSYTVVIGWMGFGHLAKLHARNDLRKKINSFRAKWGDSNYEKGNTQGKYADIALSVLRVAYRNISVPGGPVDYTRRFSIRYWGVPDAFERKNWNPPTEAEKEKFRNSFMGRFIYGDALRDHYANEK